MSKKNSILGLLSLNKAEFYNPGACMVTDLHSKLRSDCHWKNFQKMLNPSYNILSIRRLDSKQCRSIDEVAHGEIFAVCKFNYSRLSLSRLRLSRTTAYLEVKIWSMFK